MKFNTLITLVALPSVIYAAAVPQPTAKAQYPKRQMEISNQNVLSDKIWTTTNNEKITPTVIDGVTLSASPVTNSATPWVSLDSSGIPYGVTPSVKDGTTISASPTPSASSFPTPDAVPPVLRCMNDRVPPDNTMAYPFCVQNGTEFLIGETYWITWDPSYWGGDDITRVKLQIRAYPLKDDEDPVFVTEWISNADGYYIFESKASNMRTGSAGWGFLNITPQTTSETKATYVGTKSGPLVRILRSKSEADFAISRVPSDNGLSKSKGSSNNAKVIAPAVAIPVVVLIFVGFGVYWYINKQKKQGLNIGGGGGYFGSKAERTGAGAAGTAGVNHDLASTASAELESHITHDARTIDTVTTGNTAANPFK
ncbi:hypothetical protein LJB42_000239 [Komagataella kurtzmanii]|nr:hypothetical protein LJB42_000239 [Komagataella kurtzmanii]